MKILKINLLKKYNSIITIILAFLGFSTFCESCVEYGTPPVEYGSPTAKFIVKGTVQAEDNLETIPQIRVIIGWDTTYSDQEGKYEVIQSTFPGDQAFDASFTDVDGSTNGEFQPCDTIVEFIDPLFENGDGGWYKGETEKIFNIKLKKK